MKEKFSIRHVIYLIVIVLALSCLVPMLNVVALSLSSSSAVAANAVGLWPVDLTLAAYERIMSDQQFWRSFGISVIRVIVSLLLNLLMIVTMAYPLSKSKSISNEKIIHGRDGFAMLFSGGMIPTYLVVRNLGLLNTIWSLILPSAVPIGSVILVMNFFREYPNHWKNLLGSMVPTHCRFWDESISQCHCLVWQQFSIQYCRQLE